MLMSLTELEYTYPPHTNTQTHTLNALSHTLSLPISVSVVSSTTIETHADAPHHLSTNRLDLAESSGIVVLNMVSILNNQVSISI